MNRLCQDLQAYLETEGCAVQGPDPVPSGSSLLPSISSEGRAPSYGGMNERVSERLTAIHQKGAVDLPHKR